MDSWSRNRYSFKQFLHDYVTCHASDKDPPHIRRLANSAQSHRIRNMKDALKSEDVQKVILEALEWDVFLPSCIKLIVQELDTLIGIYPFVDWSAHRDVEYNAKAAACLIKEKAPTWWQLWTQLLHSQHSRPKHTIDATEAENVITDDGLDGDNHYHWVILVTAVVLRTRGKKRANLIITNLSLYLQGCSMKKRCYEYLQKHGLVISQRALSNRHTEIENASMVRPI